MLVHVRKYDQRDDGGLFQTNKGIALNLEKWKKLEEWKAQNIFNKVFKYRGNQEVDYMIQFGGFGAHVIGPKAEFEHLQIFLGHCLDFLSACERQDLSFINQKGEKTTYLDNLVFSAFSVL